jgi:hypothetical protein
MIEYNMGHQYQRMSISKSLVDGVAVRRLMLSIG